MQQWSVGTSLLDSQISILLIGKMLENSTILMNITQDNIIVKGPKLEKTQMSTKME